MFSGKGCEDRILDCLGLIIKILISLKKTSLSSTMIRLDVSSSNLELDWQGRLIKVYAN